MEQPSIFEFWQPKRRSSEERLIPSLEIFDLFCGAGGFSTGSELAGAPVTFACDSDVEAVDCYRLNHPRVVCRVLQLPSPNIPFPQDGRAFHVHGSPPCQQFSQLRGRSENPTDHALGLVRWFVDTALACGATSWSMEQVPSAVVLETLEDYRCRFREKVHYAVIDFALLGVPQTRKRVIAGSPHLVRALQRECSQHKIRCIQDVLSPNADYMRSSKVWTRREARITKAPYQAAFVYHNDPHNLANFRKLSKPAFTVTGGGNARWAVRESNGLALRICPVSDLATLQTFPNSYTWPRRKRVAHQMVGNAVPPLAAKLLMKHTRVCACPSGQHDAVGGRGASL